MSKNWHAVILAAGRGSRLGDETDATPKSLLPIGPRSLSDPTPTSFLRRQVELLQELPQCSAITVVIGYQREQMKQEIDSWRLGIRTVVNPTPEIQTSGSLHSFQFAFRDGRDILDGKATTVLMDADIVYHRDVLHLFAETREQTSLLVCDRYEPGAEEVLVFGTQDAPRFLGKGLSPELAGDSPCLGEATGIVKFAPHDHALARQTINWLLGDPDAPSDSLAYRGFGPARRATEHEELTQRFMHYRRIGASIFSGDQLPFMEVDNPEEYAELRNKVYPQILQMEAGLGNVHVAQLA